MSISGSSKPPSFDAVFPRMSENFAYDNPALRIMVQEAASKTLTSAREDNRSRARKLFLLEKLSEPTLAPPVAPQVSSPRSNNSSAQSIKADSESELRELTKRMQATGSWAQQKKNVETVRQSMHVRERGASTVRKKKGTKEGDRWSANYDPNATALQLRIGDSNKFYPIVTLACDTRLEHWGWISRVQILKDVAFQLKRVHESGLAHHNLLNDVDAMLIDSTTLRGTLADPSGSVVKSNSDIDQKMDVFAFGKTMFMLICRGKFSDPAPSFPTKMDFQKMPYWDEITVQELDSSLRVTMNDVNTPGSLLELCAQCCSLNLDLRPSAEDVWNWLDSILDDLDKAQQEDPKKLEQLVADIQAFDLAFINSPRLIDLTRSYDDDLASESTFATSDQDIFSVASDESVVPRDILLGSNTSSNPSAENDKGNNRKSRLMDFLSATTPSNPSTTDSGSGQTKESEDLRRVQSFDLATMTQTLPSAITVNKDSPPQGAQEAKDHELVRRRSLDRGYLWAKAKLEGGAQDGNDSSKSPKGKPNPRTVKTDAKALGEAWKIARKVQKPRTSKEIAALFKNQERLPPEEAASILQKAELVLRKEPNLLELKPPVLVFGDIHGQFFDLLNMLQIAGFGDDRRKNDVYLFLGDYVDRGDFSCEVLLYLMSLKSEFPNRFYFLRGNHEARSVSGYFGFKKEAEVKYGLAMFNRACSAFQAMPIAAVLSTEAGRWLCCHGGISPNVTSLAQFKEFNRFVEPGMNGFLCDLLWSDPVKDTHEDGTNMSLAEFLQIEYLPNPVRGCSYRFGFRSVISFLAVNKLVGIIRAHEVIQNGYCFHFQRSDAEYLTPPVVTVFSAPNYCGRYGNRGAMLRVNAKPAVGGGRRRGVKPMELIEPIVFSEVTHPPPMVFENTKQSEVEGRIVETCPYMPTTFQGFFERSLELTHTQVELTNKHEIAAIAAATLPTLKEDGEDSEHVSRKRTSRPISFRGGLLPQRLRGMSSVVKRVTDPLKRFQEAVQNDSVNELNPALLEEKVAKAKQKNQAFMNGVEDSNDALTVVVLSPTSSTSSSSQSKIETPGKMRMERKPSIQTVSRRDLRAGSSAGDDNASSGSGINSEATDTTITFTSSEILALQLLFLLIDRQDKGAIDLEDLISWSAEAGSAVPRTEAQACLSALDLDRDGKVGFLDYLGFAARAKDKWLLEKYVEVKIL